MFGSQASSRRLTTWQQVVVTSLSQRSTRQRSRQQTNKAQPAGRQSNNTTYKRHNTANRPNVTPSQTLAVKPARHNKQQYRKRVQTHVQRRRNEPTTSNQNQPTFQYYLLFTELFIIFFSLLMRGAILLLLFIAIIFHYAYDASHYSRLFADVARLIFLSPITDAYEFFIKMLILIMSFHAAHTPMPSPLTIRYAMMRHCRHFR